MRRGLKSWGGAIRTSQMVETILLYCIWKVDGKILCSVLVFASEQINLQQAVFSKVICLGFDVTNS